MTGERDGDIAGIKERFRSFSEDEREAEDLVSRYLQATASHINGLERALAAGDAAGASIAAHRAAGPCDLFGAASLASYLRELEKLADRREWAGTEGLLEKLHKEFTRIRAGLAEGGRVPWGH